MNTLTIPLPKLEPKHLAQIFWEMDDAQQGEFFDQLGILVMSTPAPFSREVGSMFGLDWQMYHAHLKATPLGKDVMSRFGENGVRILRPSTTQFDEDPEFEIFRQQRNHVAGSLVRQSLSNSEGVA